MDSGSEIRPYFSIVIPVYNRETEIRRAVGSCLSQPVVDIEVVIVDDGSQDQTVAVVESLHDPRIVLIRHTENQGVCRARNTGIDHSRGEWVLFLDSDDELLPGSLAVLREETAACPTEIDKLGFLLRRENGVITPSPAPENRILDYAGFLTWVDKLIISDFFQCTRRQTFNKVRFAQSRAYEDSYLLDFAMAYKIRTVPVPVAVVHLDSVNRISDSHKQDPDDRKIDEALDQLEAIADILFRHGPALRQYAPNHFRVYRRTQVTYSFLVGRRWSGISRACSYLLNYPASLKGWAILLAGLMGPRILAKVKSLQHRWLASKPSSDREGVI